MTKCQIMVKYQHVHFYNHAHVDIVEGRFLIAAYFNNCMCVFGKYPTELLGLKKM